MLHIVIFEAKIMYIFEILISALMPAQPQAATGFARRGASHIPGVGAFKTSQLSEPKGSWLFCSLPLM